MAPILYHVPRMISSPIYQAMIYLNADITVQTLTFADLKTPEHLARNPMGTSPTLVDIEYDISIWESGAILSYLLEEYDPTFRLSPPQPSAVGMTTTNRKHDRAIFLHIQQYILATVYPFMASLYIHTLKSNEEQDIEYIKLSISKWRTLFAPTLIHFLGDKEYFLGNDRLTAVDFLVAKPLSNAKSMGLLNEFPPLLALFQRISSMPSFAIAYGESSTSTSTPSSTTSASSSPKHLHQLSPPPTKKLRHQLRNETSSSSTLTKA